MTDLRLQTGILALALAALALGGGTGELTWRRRALRSDAPQGYLAIVAVDPGEADAPSAAIACEAEGTELRVAGRRWQVLAGGTQAAQGVLEGAARRFCVKRTARRLLLGVGDRWVYGAAVAAPQGKPAIRVGVDQATAVATLRLVAREPVRFADDFPDPVPKAGVWSPVRGRWALRSLSYTEQSANPAELAAVFDDFEDVASRDRTRTLEIGIGVMLDRRYPVVEAVASGSPAHQGGIAVGDRIRSIGGVAVSSATEAGARLQGKEGDAVRLTVERGGERREVALERALVVWGKAHRIVPIPPAAPDDVGLITAGFDFWTDYTFTCGTQVRGVGGLGLVFAWLGPGDYHLFRGLAAEKVVDGTGRWQLVRVRGGREQVLAEREGGFLPNEFYKLSVAVGGDAPGAVRAVGSVDGVTVAAAADDAIVPGKLGLWAAGPGAVSFDDVLVGQPEDRKPTRGSANPYHRTDPIMRAWADPAYSWEYRGLGQQWYHRSDFPGDVAVTVPFAPGKAMTAVICSDRDENASGYGLHVGEDGATRLSRAGKTLAEMPIGGTQGKKLTLRRTGRRVRVLLDGQPRLAHDDPQPLDGAAVYIRGVLARDARIDCPNVVEDYFNAMPTEWHVVAGQWEVMNRWVCKRTWSFFGGRSDGLLGIASKRRLEGDAYLDVHLGVMMMAYGGYQNMRDIGLTLGCDGNDVATGYAAIIGASQNSVTALFRNGKLVAQTRDTKALLPKQWMDGRDGQGKSQHRGWVHLKLVREGSRVAVYVWGRRVLDYDDPQPLPGGHAAIWSVDNGLLLARARLAAGRVGEPRPFLRGHRTFADGALTNDCLGGHTRIAADGPVYTLTNTLGGGPFAVALRPRVFSALERPRLTFDVKLTPEAKVDLYFRCRGKLYRVALNGAGRGIGACYTLGRFDGAQPDGQWHTVSFDLLKALRAQHPLDGLLMVWEPLLANHSNEAYLLAGFGGNRAGTTYWLRNVRLEPAGERTTVSHKPPAAP